MNIGIDVHGCIDLYPKIFSNISHGLHLGGHRIFIVTGQESKKVKPVLKKLDIYYDQILSIVDYHKKLGTTVMWLDDDKTFWMNELTWKRSKGEFIFQQHIDIHFDDSLEYAKFIPSFCTYILVPKKGFELFYRHISYLK